VCKIHPRLSLLCRTPRPCLSCAKHDTSYMIHVGLAHVKHSAHVLVHARMSCCMRACLGACAHVLVHARHARMSWCMRACLGACSSRLVHAALVHHAPTSYPRADMRRTYHAIPVFVCVCLRVFCLGACVCPSRRLLPLSLTTHAVEKSEGLLVFEDSLCP
jgi:hypothetical protein